jgi:hypothetical protein
MILQEGKVRTGVRRRKNYRRGLQLAQSQGWYLAMLLLVLFDESAVAKVQVRGCAFVSQWPAK